MGNPYKVHRDDVIHGIMDEMHNRLKNGGAATAPFHGTDHAKPSLNNAPAAPLNIKKSVPQRITLRMPWE